jgi:hypothetical protein
MLADVTPRQPETGVKRARLRVAAAIRRERAASPDERLIRFL